MIPSTDSDSLQRFLEAQKESYDFALSEIMKGRKRSHWMWYIFPQMAGLGYSETSRYYGIKSKSEAQAYLNHPILGARLIEISEVLLSTSLNDALSVFGSPDDLKLHSCMTLFASLKDTHPVFLDVIDRFFQGEKDSRTIALLQRKS